MTGTERESVIHELNSAVYELLPEINPLFLQKPGSNIGYALAKARSPPDVAAVSGGINLNNGVITPGGPVGFDVDKEISRLILTAMKFEPEIRCVANLSYHETAISASSDLLYETIIFDRDNEPPGISTMDWGVALVSKDGVPDVIYSQGGKREPPVFRLFGENPEDVRTKIIKIGQHMAKDNFGGELNGN